MIFKIVCVFPVPGGPWITLIGCSRAFLTASYWLLLHPKGKMGAYPEFPGLVSSFCRETGSRYFASATSSPTKPMVSNRLVSSVSPVSSCLRSLISAICLRYANTSVPAGFCRSRQDVATVSSLWR